MVARLNCDNTVNMGRQTVLTKKRGPAPTGKGELVGVRLQPDLLQALDAYVASQDPDSPSRPDAVRAALRDWLTERGFLKAAAPDPQALAAKIADLDAKAAALKHDGTPSPHNALKTMKRAVVKNEATKLRNKLAKAKGGKSG